MCITNLRIGIVGAAVAVVMAGSTQAFAAEVRGQEPGAASQASIEFVARQRIKLGEPDSADLRARIRDDLETQRMLAQQALDKGLEKAPDVRAQIEVNRLAVLSKAYLDEFFKLNPVTEEAVAADYEERRKAGAIREYRVRHLSVTSEERARELLGELRNGADLAQLARENSTDPGAETNGGDIGWFRPDIFVDERFADAVAALGKGETSAAPVKTRYGWHIIRVEDGPRAVADLEPYAELKPEIRKLLREKIMKRALQEHIATLKAADTNARGGADVTRVSHAQ
jgi:peptidyl-prolyl cis-trans isomerase C